MLLELRRVTKRFGGLVAVDSVDLGLEEGRVYGLIGPNGAGKTTLLSVIAGVHRPTGGRVLFQGRDITGLPPERVCHAGIARTFQLVRVFRGLTALDNVRAAAVFGGARTSPGDVRELLALVGLAGLEDVRAEDLSYVEQKRLEVARALATKPRLLLLDEVASGLTPGELDGAMQLIRLIAQRGATVLLVEHLMDLVMRVCQYLFVLDFGHKIAEGRPEVIARDETVIKAYLGEEFRLPLAPSVAAHA